MRKTDVEFHATGYYGPSYPAVNVKVYSGPDDVKLPMCFGRVSSDGGRTFTDSVSEPEFTHEWLENNITDDQWETAWEFACQDGWEMLSVDASLIWGDRIEVHSEGRSGGWAVVIGLKEFESWDAVDLAKWARFCKYARCIVNNIPWVMVDVIYNTFFERWYEENVASKQERLFA